MVLEFDIRVRRRIKIKEICMYPQAGNAIAKEQGTEQDERADCETMAQQEIQVTLSEDTAVWNEGGWHGGRNDLKLYDKC